MKTKPFSLSMFTIALTIAISLTSCWKVNIKELSVIYVHEQVGTLIEYTPGTATFLVETMNIDNSERGTVQCYLDAAGTTPANPPAGIDASVSTGSDKRTLTFTIGQSSQAGAGTYYFRVMINDVESNVGTLVIEPAPVKTASVGAQVGTLTAGTAGSVTFSVTTANIADGSYTVTVANRPSGVTISGQVTINNNSGTLTLAGSTNIVAGTTSTLTLTIDGATSPAFTLTILPRKTVSVGAQQGTIIQYTPGGTATFVVSTVSIANSEAGTVQWYSNAGGSTPASAPSSITTSVSTGSANRTLTVSSVAGMGPGTPPGTYYFRVTIDGIESNVGTLVIVAKTVTVGTQQGTIMGYTVGSATFAIATSYIANSEAGTVQWYSNAGGSTPASAPSGIIESVSTGSANRTLTVNSIDHMVAVGTPPGTYYFRVTINGIESNVGSLVIN